MGLCRDLRVETIAEMIEDEKDFEFVRKCRVQYVRGKAISSASRPRDIASFSNVKTKRMIQAMEKRR